LPLSSLQDFVEGPLSKHTEGNGAISLSGLARKLTDALAALTLIVTYRSNAAFAALSPALKTQANLKHRGHSTAAVQTATEDLFRYPASTVQKLYYLPHKSAFRPAATDRDCW